jgi:SET domain-containing protein
MKNVIIKKSKIHGKGVFVVRDFKKGEIVLAWDVYNIIKKEDIKKLSIEEQKRISFAKGKYIVIQKPEKYVNYSCDPNTAPIDYCDVAIRDIKSGEEITSTPTFDKLRECNCGSEKCKNNK